MKKIFIISICLIALAGCNKKEKKEEVKVDETKEEEKIIASKKSELEEKLLEYGKLVYENDTWLNGGIEPFTYFMTLKEMNERNKYDINMFVNPVTGESCNLDNTRVEFIVKEKTTDKTIYEWNTVLDCGF